MPTPLLTAAALLVDREGRPVARLPSETRVTASGAALATLADRFVDGSGRVLVAISPASRVRASGVPALPADAQFAAAGEVRLVSDQTRVRIA